MKQLTLPVVALVAVAFTTPAYSQCFGNQGRCKGIWRDGRKVVVCCDDRGGGWRSRDWDGPRHRSEWDRPRHRSQGDCFGSEGRCKGFWRDGRRVVVCCD